MPQRVLAEHRRLPRSNDLAGDAPMDGNHVAGLNLLNIIFGFQPPREFLLYRLAEKKFSVCRKKRLGEHGDRGTAYGYYLAPAHAAFVHALQCVFAVKVAGAPPDVQNMKRMVWNRSLSDFLFHECE